MNTSDSAQRVQARLMHLESLPKWLHSIIAVLGLLLFAFLDYLTGVDLHLFLFYALPIAYTSWFLGRRYSSVLVLITGLIFWWINFHLQIQNVHILISTWNFIARLIFFLLVSQGIGILNKSYKYLQELAEVDMLTGLKNRRVFYKELDIAIARSQRNQNPLTVAYLDLDLFKQVNDSLGHHIGDELLQKVAQTMLMTLRKTDLAARLGGDEFALFLEGNQPAQAHQAMERLQKNLMHSMQENNWSVTFSIGMVTYLEIPDNPQEMIQKADQLMYQIKHSGRGRILAEVYPAN